jgi:hypothetical protein
MSTYVYFHKFCSRSCKLTATSVNSITFISCCNNIYLQEISNLRGSFSFVLFFGNVDPFLFRKQSKVGPRPSFALASSSYSLAPAGSISVDRHR